MKMRGHMKMFKKVLSALLILGAANIGVIPAIASEVYTVNSEYASAVNLNKAELNQTVQFRSTKGVKLKNGLIIPQGTIFNGKITNLKQSKGFYKRANAHVEITELVVPSGAKYEITGNLVPDNLKGSAPGNVIKGVITTPVAIAVGAVGLVFTIVEGVTIIGIPLAKATAHSTKETMGRLTKGVNCKRYEGHKAVLKVKAVDNQDAAATTVKQVTDTPSQQTTPATQTPTTTQATPITQTTQTSQTPAKPENK